MTAPCARCQSPAVENLAPDFLCAACTAAEEAAAAKRQAAFDAWAEGLDW